VALAVTLALGSTSAVQAQEAAAAQQRTLDEVIVTAQRRQETVQEIPIAVSAFSSDQLNRLGVTEALDMTKLVPNF
jgi:iron complex outermembrane receptor protein